MLSYCVELMSTRISRGRDYCRAVCQFVPASKSVLLRPPSWRGMHLSMSLRTILVRHKSSSANRSSLLPLVVSHFSERALSGVPRALVLSSVTTPSGVFAAPRCFGGTTRRRGRGRGRGLCVLHGRAGVRGEGQEDRWGKQGGSGRVVREGVIDVYGSEID